MKNRLFCLFMLLAFRAGTGHAEGVLYRCVHDGQIAFSVSRITGSRCDAAQRWVERDPLRVDQAWVRSVWKLEPVPGGRSSAMAKPGPIRASLDTVIRAQAQRWNVDESLVRAVIHAESAFNPRARSPKGAMGLMQLMPATARRFGVRDAFDPVQNVSGGVQYLAWLLQRFQGDWRLALAGYNAGEGAVAKYGGVPPYRETQAYLAKVWRLSQSYRRIQRK